jgi:hypothetical protein
MAGAAAQADRGERASMARHDVFLHTDPETTTT